LSACGVTVVAVNYRLVPRARFPRPIARSEGSGALAAWERAAAGPAHRADRHLGASAGAYLGSLLARTAGIDRLEGTVGGHFGQSSAVQAAVRWFGQYDLVASGSRTEVEARLRPFAFEAGLLDVADIAGPVGRTQALSLLSWCRLVCRRS
jgi:BD-FAE protein